MPVRGRVPRSCGAAAGLPGFSGRRRARRKVRKRVDEMWNKIRLWGYKWKSKLPWLYDFFSLLYSIVLIPAYYMRRKNFLVVNDVKKVVYLQNAKVACTSLESSVRETRYKARHHGVFRPNDHLNRGLGRYRDYFKFTFVRNPYSRLVSCYENKYHRDKELGYVDRLCYDSYLMGYMKRDGGFEHFLKKVCALPDFIADKHFCSQYRMIYDRRGRCMLDFVGHFERLEEEYAPIQQKYGLLPILRYNVTKKVNWMDYYTRETARLVHDKFREDFQAFDYEHFYHELLEYIEKKG